MSHPDYANAKPRQRYGGGALRGLFVLLDQESQTKPAMVPCSRVLPSGAGVQMWRTVAGGRVIRIARSEKFKTAEGPAKWETELATFVEKFGVGAWYRVDDRTAPGVAAVFHEHAPGPRCTKCGELLDATAIGALADTCVDCSLPKRRLAAGWQYCDAPGCTNEIEINPTFMVNHCQTCAIAAGRRYAEALRAGEHSARNHP